MDEEEVKEKSELKVFEQLEQLTTEIERLEERCQHLENKLTPTSGSTAVTPFLQKQAPQFTRTLYKNGDIKEKRSDGSIHYFFATYGLRHYVYPSGLEMTTYKNGQVQRKNPDGTTEILYPNGCVKVTRSNGNQEFIFPDNTVYQRDEKGNTLILLPNGQKEIHNDSWKKRIFPDGTTKIVYLDGSTETTYSNGRIRVKNSSGKLVLDTQNIESVISESSCVDNAYYGKGELILDTKHSSIRGNYGV